MTSALLARFDSELTEQPGLGQLHVAHDRVDRHVENGGSLLHAQAAEKAEFDDTTFSLVHGCQGGQGVVERHQVPAAIVRDRESVDERHLHGPAASLLVLATARVVNEYPPHQPRRHRKEVVPILPVDPPGIDQAHVRFIQERRRLQAVAGALAPHAGHSDPVELGVHQRNEAFERRLVAPSPGQEQGRYIRGRHNDDADSRPLVMLESGGEQDHGE